MWPQYPDHLRKTCINRNIVECKDAELSAQDKADKVLIETSWNVKLGSPQSPLNLQDCINRNIVECKVHRRQDLHNTVPGY